MAKISLLHRESLASPLSVVLTAPPKTLLGSNFSAKFPLEVLKEVLFRHRSAAWPWGFPETHRQCSCCVMRCTVLPSRCKNILVAKPMALSLSSHWMLEQPSLHFCSLSVQAQQGTHQQQQKWDLQGWEFHSSWGKSLPKYLSQPLPSTARGTAACSAPRRAKSLPGLGRAPGWLGSLVTSPALASAMKDLIFCRFYNRNPSLIASQRATAGQSHDPSSHICCSEAQRALSEAQSHLGFLSWDLIQQPSAVLSLLTHSGAQEISLLPATDTQWPVATSSPIFLLFVSVVTVAEPHLSPWQVPWPPWQRIASDCR